jgi:hypothetical protein
MERWFLEVLAIATDHDITIEDILVWDSYYVLGFSAEEAFYSEFPELR